MRPERDALEIRFPRVEGYRVELPEERLTADFTADHVLELTPELTGPTRTRVEGIIGEGIDINVEHLGDMRPSTLIFHLTRAFIGERPIKVLAYVKNHNLGLEVPYRYGSDLRKYLPDFIVLVDDGHGPADPLHLIFEIKGYRREDAKEKDSTMQTYWIPGVNHLKTHGRLAFAEFCDVYEIESDFEQKVESHFTQMIEELTVLNHTLRTSIH